MEKPAEPLCEQLFGNDISFIFGRFCLGTQAHMADYIFKYVVKYIEDIELEKAVQVVRIMLLTMWRRPT